MLTYIQKLNAYIKSNPATFDNDCPLPTLDSIYWHYTEYHSMSDVKVKQAARDLNAFLHYLPAKEQDEIFCLANALCAEHERTAFIAGLQLGAQLMMELMPPAES